MVTENKVEYENHRVEEQIVIRGSCIPYSRYDKRTMTMYSAVSPDRPSRRPKPDFLLMSPTDHGAFHRTAYKSRIELWRYDVLSCGGKPAYAYRLKSEPIPCNDVFPQAGEGLALPPWEIVMRNKIKNDRVNMAETIGEWRETARAVKEGANALRKAVRFIKYLRRQPKHLWPIELRYLWSRRETLSIRDVPGAYLCTIFGILPWAQLANDSAEALSQFATQGVYKRYSVTRKVSGTEVVQGTKGGSCTIQIHKTVRAVFVVRYKVTETPFTSGNPLEALWAGVPLSFMVDWFIGIGAWLSAIDALEGVQSTKGTVTTRVRKTAVDSRQNLNLPTTWKNVGVSPGTAYYKSYDRKVVDTIGFPWHVEWQNSAEWGKLLTSLAILHELRRQ